MPHGDHRWLTVVSPDDPDGTELLLQPAPTRRQSLQRGAGQRRHPFTSVTVVVEVARLERLGVLFTQEPLEMGPVATAVFDDTRGNLIQIAHPR
jgi:hypothetical protein